LLGSGAILSNTMTLNTNPQTRGSDSELQETRVEDCSSSRKRERDGADINGRRSYFLEIDDVDRTESLDITSEAAIAGNSGSLEHSDTEKDSRAPHESGVRPTRSKCWQDFDRKEIAGIRYAVCKHCSKMLKLVKSAGTGTMRHHIAMHKKNDSISKRGGRQTSIDAFKKEVTDPGGTEYQYLPILSEDQRKMLVLWMSKRNIPLAEVEDPDFRLFLLSMNPSVRCVSRNTVKSWSMDLYEEMKNYMSNILSNEAGGLCVAVDGWTSESQNRSYIGIVVSFIHNWERKSCLLSLREPESDSQTAEVVAQAIYEELKAFNVHKNLFAMISDNGSNMIAAWPVLIELLAKDGIQLDQDMHARCVCHVVNILVRGFLKDIGANKPMSASTVPKKDESQARPHADAVNLIRFLTVYIHSSPKRLKRFKTHQMVLGKVLLPMTETITRWNSTFLMLERALQIKEALSAGLIGEEFVSQALPTNATWECIRTIVDFLSPFHRITQQLQGNVALTASIPCYNEMFDHVEDWKDSLRTKLGPGSRLEEVAWKTALEKCTDMLKKYYVKTDSKLYSGVTYCDPRMRNYYWKDAGYESVWISRALAQVKEVYASKYLLHGKARMHQSNADYDESDPVQRVMKARLVDNGDELSMYERGAPADGDPLSWWKLHEPTFPGLSKMARDMLGVPATTASAERIFSQAKLIMTDQRSRLDSDTAGKLVSIGSWMRTFDVGIQ